MFSSGYIEISFNPIIHFLLLTMEIVDLIRCIPPFNLRPLNLDERTKIAVEIPPIRLPGDLFSLLYVGAFWFDGL